MHNSIDLIFDSSNVRRSSQTGESTGDRLAFSDFELSSGYKNCNPTGSRIKFKLPFLECDRIPDHHSYIVDRVNLNIDRVGFCEYFISSESGWAIVMIRSYVTGNVTGINRKSCDNQYFRYIVTYKSLD